jgi:hypothetical protein
MADLLSRTEEMGNPDGLQFSPIHMSLRCPICDKAIVSIDSEIDMHEVIFTRGDVTKTGEEAMQAIMDPCNCVLVHRWCHAKAEGKQATISCIRYLILWEGYTHVDSFMLRISEYVPVIALQKKRLVNEVWKRIKTTIQID